MIDERRIQVPYDISSFIICHLLFCLNETCQIIMFQYGASLKQTNNKNKRLIGCLIMNTYVPPFNEKHAKTRLLLTTFKAVPLIFRKVERQLVPIYK